MWWNAQPLAQTLNDKEKERCVGGGGVCGLSRGWSGVCFVVERPGHTECGRRDSRESGPLQVCECVLSWRLVDETCVWDVGLTRRQYYRQDMCVTFLPLTERTLTRCKHTLRRHHDMVVVCVIRIKCFVVRSFGWQHKRALGCRLLWANTNPVLIV